MATVIPAPILDRSLQQALLGFAQPIGQGLAVAGENRALRQFAEDQGINFPVGTPPDVMKLIIARSFDPFGLRAGQAGLIGAQTGLAQAQAGQIGQPTPLDPATEALRQAQEQETIARTGQIGLPGQPTLQTPEERALTKARTLETLARTQAIPPSGLLSLDEQRKRELIAAGIEPKTISKLEQKNIRSQIAKNRAEAEKLLRAGKGVLTPEQKISQANTFRKEFDALSKDFRKIRDSFGRIQVAAADPSAAGDLAIIFNFMKILDPGSVVRESEFATAENAAGVPDKIRNMWNRALTGERITFNRDDFVKTSERLFKAQERTQNRLVNRYTTLSNRFGINPQDVVTETGEFDTGGQPQSPQQFQVGQTVINNGQQFKITGFDRDGTPIGEPVR